MPAIDQPTIETVRRPRRRLLILAAIAVATMLVPVGGESIEAAGSSETTETTVTFSTCAGSGGNLLGHSRPYLTDFTVPSPVSPFYAAGEGADVEATITVTGLDYCGGPLPEPGRADYLTQDGTAVDGVDYQGIDPPMRSDELCLSHPQDACQGRQPSQDVTVPLLSDSVENTDAVRSFLFKLQNGVPDGLSTFHHTEAPVHIIDDDGANRVSLEPTLDGTQTLAYASREPSTVQIPVFWAGLGSPGNVHYTVAPGSPAPTPGVDYNVLSDNPLPPAAFTQAGGRVAFVRIQILNDKGSDGMPRREPDEIMTITLDGGGYEVVGEHGTTTLTILDSGSDSIAPVTRFHHPRQGLKYRRADYRIREFHTFYEDEGGSGMAKAHMALRRKLENGTCAWWRGGKFRRGPCSKKVWKVMKHDEQNFLFYYRFKPLRPTVGTNIKHYRAWTRGRDFAGNVEKKFTQGRNQSTFWVRKK